jgi:hypothetical protein
MKITILFTFIANLFAVLCKVPRAITILKIVMDIAGSDAVKMILETVRDAAQKIKRENTSADSLPPAVRKRLGERLKWRLGQQLLGLDDQQLAQTLQAFGKENIA